MKLAFFGTSEFAIPALKKIAPFVTLVVSQPDRPTGRGLRVQQSPLKQAALELGLLVETPEKARNPEFVQRIETENFDALIVAAYGQILSERLLNASRLGGINLHGSLLPRYRGAAPIQRAILNLEQTTGVTLMQMDKGMDTGDIIMMRELNIEGDETYGQLQSRLAELGAEMIADFLPALESGQYDRTPQEHGLATHAGKIEKHETRLIPTGKAIEEYARYRAFHPRPGTSIEIEGEAIKVLEAKVGTTSGPPGTILRIQPVLEIAFSAGSMELHTVQPPGKKPVSGQDFANGRRLKVGESV